MAAEDEVVFYVSFFLIPQTPTYCIHGKFNYTLTSFATTSQYTTYENDKTADIHFVAILI